VFKETQILLRGQRKSKSKCF